MRQLETSNNEWCCQVVASWGNNVDRNILMTDAGEIGGKRYHGLKQLMPDLNDNKKEREEQQDMANAGEY